MIYTVFRKTTGQIAWIASSVEEPKLPDEFGFIIGEADGVTQYVKNGVLVALPLRPSPYHEFDFTKFEWFDPNPEPNFVLDSRNQMLSATDWTQLPDVPESTRLKYIAYRQALRDITDQPGYPYDIVWPTPPQ
jgi:hypothetical protein